MKSVLITFDQAYYERIIAFRCLVGSGTGPFASLSAGG